MQHNSWIVKLSAGISRSDSLIRVSSSSPQPVCLSLLTGQDSGKADRSQSHNCSFLATHHHTCFSHGLKHPQDPSGRRDCLSWFCGKAIECPGLEGILKMAWFHPLPCPRGPTLGSGGSEHHPAWPWTLAGLLWGPWASLSSQEEFLLIPTLNLSSFSLNTFPLPLSLSAHVKQC